MITNVLKKIFGSRNDRLVKQYRQTVVRINALEDGLAKLSDEQIQAKTDEFKRRIQQGETPDQLLVEAFAVCREASKRVLKMRHFDVQMIGGMVLHYGKIAEMRTGEGKTLVATLPVYLNALAGKGVHVVTVNDYLAARDSEWMGAVYKFLGLSVGCILHDQPPDFRRAQYNCDITYGTNAEFGFDYLRDNGIYITKEEQVQRGHHYAIVDEVDSILIDEARTPLIISGQAEDSSELYRRINRLIPKLTRAVEASEVQPAVAGHYLVDEKLRQVELTEEGHEHVEQLLTEAGLLGEGESLYSAANLGLLHHVHTALRAHVLFHRDVEYIVQNGQVILIDEHTGRTMPGRRLSEGLHQAIEAREGVAVQAESQTLASTTFQNYFRLYHKLSGMTGTADTEAFELKEIYNLDVVVIPTNKPMLRIDHNDLVYLTLEEKYDAIIADIESCRAEGRPVLVGTASIESSELLSSALKKRKIEHKVLNAKYHEQEAQIVAQAGQPGAVTIATNMAGRGTDIVLGGNFEVELTQLGSVTPEQREAARQAWQLRHEQVLASGGLHIIGTERHESRRIDNQLRGRSGRQGDPGSSRFYLSLEDNLMRIFASERMRQFMQRLGMEQGEAIEHRMVSNAIEKAQRKVEGRNFDIRKQLLEYDDVANEQRQIVYRQRRALLESDDISDTIVDFRKVVVNEVIDEFIPPQSLEEQWNIAGLEQHLSADLALSLPLAQWLDQESDLHEATLRERILQALIEAYERKGQLLGTQMRLLEKQVMLQILDNLWKEHLATMDHLRQGIHLRAYAQRNPKQEYKREAFELFQQLLSNLRHEVVKTLSRIEIVQEDIEEIERRRREEQARQALRYQHDQASALQPPEEEAAEAAGAQPYVRVGEKVGRNAPCPCGSGKKYKQCHGKLD